VLLRLPNAIDAHIDDVLLPDIDAHSPASGSGIGINAPTASRVSGSAGRVLPLRLCDRLIHGPVAELLALQGRGDVPQEGTPVADRHGLGGAQHGGELVIGEAERAVGYRCGY
jgi:hypothetical protein